MSWILKSIQQIAYQQQHSYIFILWHQCTGCSQRPKESMVYLFYFTEKQCIIFEGQFVYWLDPSLLISAHKCFSDNSYPVLDTDACLFPTGKILTCKAAKNRASTHGTDLGMRTLSKELEVPSNPKLSTPPWLPQPGHCSTPLHPRGGRADAPHRREGSAPTNSGLHGALTFAKENFTELFNIEKLHRTSTKCAARELLIAQKSHLASEVQDADDWGAICPVLDLLRHSLLAMTSYYTVIKEMFLLDLAQYRQSSSQTTDIWSRSSRCVNNKIQTSKTEKGTWKPIYDTTARKTLPLRSHC